MTYKSLNLTSNVTDISAISRLAEAYYNEMMKLKYGLSEAINPSNNRSLSKDLAKASGGPLLTEIINNMVQKYQNHLNETVSTWIEKLNYVR